MSKIKIRPHSSQNIISPFIMTIYITCVLVSLSLSNKIIIWHGYIILTCLVTLPILFLIGDIVAEIYGYKAASRLIWYTLLSCILFSLLIIPITHIPSVNFHDNSDAYLIVFGQDLKFSLIGVLAIFSGLYVNAYLISKWKFLTKGKFFLIRCIGASVVGEFVNSLIAVPAAFIGKVNYNLLFNMTITSFVIKLGCAVILAYPATFIVSIMKSRMNINDVNIITDSELWKK